MFHDQFTDPLDIHVTRNAVVANLGDVLAYDGLGGEYPVRSHHEHLDIALPASGEITLTAAQASKASLRFTGTISADVSIRVPANWGPVLVENIAVGDYAVRVASTIAAYTTLRKYWRRCLLARSGSIVSFIPEAHSGFAEYAVAGDVDEVLSGSEVQAAVLRLTGVLTADIDVVVPDSWGPVVVENATTGTFTLTVKTALGTGVAITASTRRLLAVSDGDVVPCAAAV
jgi:hypothetical protein